MSDYKAKEFWINLNTKGYSENLNSAPLSGAIHAIEYAAYASLLKEYNTICAERDTLKSRCQQLQERWEECAKNASDARHCIIDLENKIYGINSDKEMREHLLRKEIKELRDELDESEAKECKCHVELANMKELLKSIDQHLCERIIDPCGFDPKKETRDDLINLVIGLSDDNDLMLKKIREALK